MNLEGRHVVVTGATGGVGPTVVDALLSAGATCHVPAHSDGERLREGSRRGALRIVGGIDLTSEAAVGAFYAGCPPLWGSVHLAGGYRDGALADATLADLRGLLDRNLITTFLCCREAVRNMRATGAGRGGRLVNVSARAASHPVAGQAAYTASKAAVAALTQALAIELRGEAILVNAILPSTIDTGANRAAMPGADPGRWVQPDEIAATIGWLLSPAASATSGALLPLAGRG